jgi:rubredoxin
MTRYVCDACGWVYDPEDGLPEFEIEPGTPFDGLPEEFVCPECGVGKDIFSPED